MITTSTGQSPALAMLSTLSPAVQDKPALNMVSADRMAGPVAVWSKAGDTGDAARMQAMANKDLAENQITTNTSMPTTAATRPFTFHDLLDIINPLQHIPVVSQIYRHFTGATINPAMQVIGDTMLGGPIGGAISMANVIVTQATGRDIPRTVTALATGQALDVPPTTPDKPATAPVVLRYTDAGGGQRTVYERVSAASDRLPGSMIRIRTEAGSASDGMAQLAQATANNQMASLMPAAGSAHYARQSAFHSLHLNA